MKTAKSPSETLASDNTWYILGAGSIGLLWACHLHTAGEPVRVLTRKTIKKNALPITWQRSAQQHLAVTLPACSISDSPIIRRLLVCVKSHQLTDALVAIRSRLADEATVVLCMNGMGLYETATQYLPRHHLYLATTTYGANRPNAQTLRSAGEGSTLIGQWQASPQRRMPSNIADLAKGLSPIIWVEDIQTALWKKLAINAAINPLTALFRCTNGELLTEPRLQWLMGLCLETQNLFDSMQLKLEKPVVVLVTEVATATASNRSSMLQDVQQGRLTEIDAITGYLLASANQNKMSLALHARVFSAVKANENWSLFPETRSAISSPGRLQSD